MTSLSGLVQETALGLESRYNETFWFPLARDAVSSYLEVSWKPHAVLRIEQ